MSVRCLLLAPGCPLGSLLRFKVSASPHIVDQSASTEQPNAATASWEAVQSEAWLPLISRLSAAEHLLIAAQDRGGSATHRPMQTHNHSSSDAAVCTGCESAASCVSGSTSNSCSSCPFFLFLYSKFLPVSSSLCISLFFPCLFHLSLQWKRDHWDVLALSMFFFFFFSSSSY